MKALVRDHSNHVCILTIPTMIRGRKVEENRNIMPGQQGFIDDQVFGKNGNLY